MTPEEATTPALLGEKLFQWRDYTPIPLIILLIFLAEPSAVSATLGLVFIFAGELLRIYGVAFIGSISRTRSSSLGPKLITEGPFAYSRNPLYLGNFLISTGVAVYGGVFWFVLVTVAATAFQYHCIVQYEEQRLTEQFGDEYVNYTQTVPRWFPQKLPALNEIQWPTSYYAALKSEKKTFMAIIATVFTLMLISAGR